MKPVNYLVLLWLLLLAGLAAPQAVAEDLQAPHLRIQLNVKDSRKLPKKSKEEYAKDWDEACHSLGEAMSVGKGPYGFGAFASYSCYRGSKLISGDDLPSRWVLSVVDGKNEAKFSLLHQEDKGLNRVAEYGVPSSEFTLSFFKDAEFTDLVAFALLDGAPMGMRLTKADIKGKTTPQFRGRYWRAGQARDFKYDVPEAPETLVIYRLRWSDKEHEWRSETVGTARRVTVHKPKRKKKAKVMTGGDVIYETTPDVVQALAAGPLWAQSAAGPGAQHKLQTERLKEAQIAIAAAAQSGHLANFMAGEFDLLSSLLSSTASGYVGLRYGREALPGTGGLGQLMKETSVLGVLVEVRGGPLKGLRYYYDLMPKAMATVGGTDGPVETKIQFARHTFGYSFGFDPHLLVDRVTLDPRVGVLNFSATLPTAVDDQGHVASTSQFHLNRALSLGLEVGLEEESDWYTLRAWYGINTGLALLKDGGKVTSNQFGVASFLKVGPSFNIYGVPFKVAVMGFYFFESFDLSAPKTNVELAEGESRISGVAFSVGYAGLGLALSW